MSSTLTGALAPFEWKDTKAFVGFHGDLWLNLQGREPEGVVAPRDVDRVLEEISAGLLEIVDPATGGRVFERVWRREEIYDGPLLERAPDLMLDSWSAGYRVAPSRGPADGFVAPPSSLAGVDVAWSADHRPQGIFVASGPNISAGSGEPLQLLDVCPTSLSLLGEAIPGGLDGKVARAVVGDRTPASTGATGASLRRDEAQSYSEEEAAAVAEHLKDLGYIE